MVPFAAAKITSKNDSPLWTLASQRSSSISIAQPRSRKFAQDYRVIAGLAEDVEILGGARDAGIGAQRVASRQQERQSQAGQLAQRLGIEQFGVPRRRRRLGCGFDHFPAFGRSLGHPQTIETGRSRFPRPQARNATLRTGSGKHLRQSSKQLRGNGAAR